MNYRVDSIDALRTIDQVLHSSRNKVSYSSDRYIDPIKPVPNLDTVNDRLHLEPSKKQVNVWVEEAQKVLQRVNAQLSFRVHEGTGRTLVELIEKDTKKVLREIPPEKMLDVIAGIWEWIGISVDRTE
ncbi:hypothetical protein GCM10008932_13540 [Alkalibacterium iburiense]|uniref:Flagellar protein FlaG n=1 Tax=Alkalibacterium iburiense TaxID=290589 RepID=A0ABN0XEP3_9LACT